MTAKCIAIFIIALMLAGVATAEPLQRDPFQRPDLNKKIVREPVAVNPANAAKMLNARTWHPHLSGTLQSPSGSFANVNGMVIKVGEEVDGFQLIKVSERTATFMKNGKAVLLSLDNTIKEVDDVAL